MIYLIFYLDVEEITQKAGSYKKFEVFQKMLFSALDKDSDSVFIDLLTFTDLEILKARRNNNVSTQEISQTPHTQISEPTKAQLKRYIILTYSSQFDRVHYPLPLNFEEIPNPMSLLKVIKRLRGELNQVHDVNNPQNSDSTSMISLTKVITQLRKENEELGQKLRFYESNQQQKTIIDGKIVNTNPTDLVTINKKLRNQLETMKKDLKDMSVAYEQLRSSSMKEILALKYNLEQYSTGMKASISFSLSTTSFKATDIITIANPIKSSDGLYSWKRILQIAEVRKHWKVDPMQEAGFVDLVKYNVKKDELEPTEDLINGDSEIIKDIASNVKGWAGNWDAIYDKDWDELE